MSAQNKTEFDNSVDLIFVPTLQISDHSDFLKDNLSESAVLKKDRIGLLTAAGASYNLDYANYDYIELDCNSLAITISILNIASGQTFYAKFTNFASINFSGVTFVGANKDNWRFVSSLNRVRFVNKSGVIYAIIESDNDQYNFSNPLNFANFIDRDVDLKVTIPRTTIFSNAPDELLDSTILSQLSLGYTNYQGRIISRKLSNVVGSIIDFSISVEMRALSGILQLITWRGSLVSGFTPKWANLSQSEYWFQNFASINNTSVYYKRQGNNVIIHIRKPVGSTGGSPSTEALPASMRPNQTVSEYRRWSGSDISILINTSGNISIGGTVACDFTFTYGIFTL